MPVCEPLLAWYDGVRRDLPWRHTRDPYRIWLSEIMLQQTRTETVKAYYARFLTLFPTVADLARAPQEQVLKAWEGLGYYSRARNLQKAAQAALADDRFGSMIIPIDPKDAVEVPICLVTSKYGKKPLYLKAEIALLGKQPISF